MIALLLLVILAFPITAHATTFWDDDFENHLYPNWIQTCVTVGDPDGVSCPWPSIATGAAHSGTHSYWSFFEDMTIQTGTFIDRYFTQSQHMYTRFWYRTHNFQYYDVGVTKHFFHTSDAGSMNTIWENDYGSRVMTAAINHPSNVTCPPDDRGGTVDITCVYSANLVEIPLNDDQWYCIETHVYTGSPSTANGVLEQWIDGVKTMNYTGLLMRSGSAGYNFIRHYAQNGQGDRYIDDLAVGDARIGCGGGGGGSTAGGGLDF
jgi:hypothetical protein